MTVCRFCLAEWFCIKANSLLAPMPILKGIRQAEVRNWSIDPNSEKERPTRPYEYRNLPSRVLFLTIFSCPHKEWLSFPKLMVARRMNSYLSVCDLCRIGGNPLSLFFIDKVSFQSSSLCCQSCSPCFKRLGCCRFCPPLRYRAFLFTRTFTSQSFPYCCSLALTLIRPFSLFLRVNVLLLCCRRTYFPSLASTLASVRHGWFLKPRRIPLPVLTFWVNYGGLGSGTGYDEARRLLDSSLFRRQRTAFKEYVELHQHPKEYTISQAGPRLTSLTTLSIQEDGMSYGPAVETRERIQDAFPIRPLYQESHNCVLLVWERLFFLLV